MIEVKPLSDFFFSVSEFNKDALTKALKELQTVPRLHKIVIHNKTKSVLIQCAMQDSELHIRVTNPQDEVFDVNQD